MLTKADITGIVSKYGPNISQHYYTLKKTPVKMLSNAFLTFANQEKIVHSVAFVDISKDKSGICGLIISKLGIHYGLENSKGFIDFASVSSCVVEFPSGSGNNQFKAILRVTCDEDEHILEGNFAKAPIKHIIDEAHALSEKNEADEAKQGEPTVAQSAVEKEVVPAEGQVIAENAAETPEQAVISEHAQSVSENKAEDTTASVEKQTVEATETIELSPEKTAEATETIELPPEKTAKQSTQASTKTSETAENKATEAPANTSESAPQSEYVRKPTSAITAPTAEERAAHFREIREKAQRETAEIAIIKAQKAAGQGALSETKTDTVVENVNTSTQEYKPPVEAVNAITTEQAVAAEQEKSVESAAPDVIYLDEPTAASSDELPSQTVEEKTNAELIEDEKLSDKPSADETTVADETSTVQTAQGLGEATTAQTAQGLGEATTAQDSDEATAVQGLDITPNADTTTNADETPIVASVEEKQNASPSASGAVKTPTIEAAEKQTEYVRKPTSAISDDDKRAAHFKEIREKAQKETAEIAEIKSGRAPLTTECRAPVKPKPNPAPFGYNETVISEMTISKNDITDIYMQEVIAFSPNPDIYSRSSDVIKNLMKKDKTLTNEKIADYLHENLASATESFLAAVKAHQSEIPPRTMHSIEVLDEAVKGMDKYIKQGENYAQRVMLFMMFQMINYTDNIIQSDETKAVCLSFIKIFGTLGIILSMLDLELY